MCKCVNSCYNLASRSNLSQLHMMWLIAILALHPIYGGGQEAREGGFTGRGGGVQEDRKGLQ